jgi:hypothetical protein
MSSLMASTLVEIEGRLLRFGEISGTDSNDVIYDDLMSMWRSELAAKKGGELPWYSKAFDYWEDQNNCPTNDDGVLGGFGFLTEADVRDSNLFIDALLQQFPQLQLNRVAGYYI